MPHYVVDVFDVKPEADLCAVSPSVNIKVRVHMAASYLRDTKYNHDVTSQIKLGT